MRGAAAQTLHRFLNHHCSLLNCMRNTCPFTKKQTKKTLTYFPLPWFPQYSSTFFGLESEASVAIQGQFAAVHDLSSETSDFGWSVPFLSPTQSFLSQWIPLVVYAPPTAPASFVLLLVIFHSPNASPLQEAEGDGISQLQAIPLAYLLFGQSTVVKVNMSPLYIVWEIYTWNLVSNDGYIQGFHETRIFITLTRIHSCTDRGPKCYRLVFLLLNM